MAERSQHRVSAGLEGRSEGPATGMGSPEPHARLQINGESLTARQASNF
jgi:hypothetical protein